MENLKKYGIRFAVYCVISVIFCFWFDNTAGFEIIKWALIATALLYGMWIVGNVLRKRIGNHIFWIVPAVTLLIYFIGTKIADMMPGLDGLGLFIMTLYITYVLVLGYLLFCAEMLYKRFKKR